MQKNSKIRRKPNIRISQSDHARLSVLASTFAARYPEASDELLAELERARIVADGWVSAGTVRMGSTVTFKPDTGDRRTVTLVFPGDADISEGKVSILTPIGTALIGLSAGQSIMWTARDGRRHELLVLGVTQPAPQGDGVSQLAPASPTMAASV
ncbi:MAG: nucleoside diphosphate kinase regulator [Mesorhizobium sp.]|uniref:nucleoside diphosphate kinase regulator n=1 Tax=unclassified Mesorhizobium TaxID=325217 RepID=UPI0007FF0F41|nr:MULTISPECIES: nucleoside diphosphate kinase regulator [unclassified Mesorhizobium]TGV91879.1 nucleoside diphosphate kinase regulator [Mesorhizobium sp. M00.F.Ca.ET.158.01.1.1]WIE90471.1 nucleoside diphosphate kinase regulator [Mesorhizobium sp. WSM4875]AZO58692.1 nucleoside diphosphate kinase regulator [Mesorhizobium sp. M1A.F.Ca.IN.022.06.1.1]MDG4891487.1 nucleoside diphosphate kinase regulator [Mesorhizobium sp. WSM4887]MDG4900865.1 nucleoside diphosphate kinase regulator [Mesorhizobium s